MRLLGPARPAQLLLLTRVCVRWFVALLPLLLAQGTCFVALCLLLVTGHLRAQERVRRPAMVGADWLHHHARWVDHLGWMGLVGSSDGGHAAADPVLIPRPLHPLPGVLYTTYPTFFSVVFAFSACLSPHAPISYSVSFSSSPSRPPSLAVCLWCHRWPSPPSPLRIYRPIAPDRAGREAGAGRRVC